MQRLIGTYEGQKEGPLLLCFGSIHGNEPAGTEAIKEVLDLLAKEPKKNKDFNFKGTFVGLIGNVKAYKQGVRYLDRDLNRIFTEKNVELVKNTPLRDIINPEFRELKEIIEIVDVLIGKYKPTKVILVDLHTTTAFGGIFSISTDTNKSINIAKALHAPVMTGFMKGIQGTTLHHFTTKRYGIEMIPIVFESGQHQEKLSVDRAVAGIINIMRSIDCVNPSDVENKHDAILAEYSKNLPNIAKLVYTHIIHDNDKFKMVPGYKNFQKVHKGEQIAYDVHGEILCPSDGLILMPLYQAQGEDGFFIIQEIEALTIA